MGYSIVFETKVVKLKDGNLLLLSLDGCVNDTSGRQRDEFEGKIFTYNGLVAHAKSFQEGNKPYKKGGEFELKIKSRPCSYYDYGQHLLRMMKRAKTWDELSSERTCYGIEKARHRVKPTRKQSESNCNKTK